MRFSVVIPMYNERDVIADTLRTLAETLEKAAERDGFDFEILVSDDGSRDGSREIVKSLSEELVPDRGTLRLISAEKNRGKGAAVRAGMLAMTGDWAAFTDSDLAYGAEVLPAMLAEARRRGADLLIGSRAAAKDGYAGYTPLRRLASKVYLRLLSATAGFRHTDSQCGCKLFSRAAARSVFRECETDGWAFDFEALMLADRMGFSVEEYPVTVLRHRDSKVRIVRDSVRMLAEVRRIRKRLEG